MKRKMKRILMSIGPIYGKLDSVKLITNRFKGGLAALTAKKLAQKRPRDKITIVKCKETEFYKAGEGGLKNVTVVDVEDFYGYERFVLGNRFDAYILAAAVANLIPKNPYKGKFPSHNYSEGDIVNIPFVIARRIISHVKEKFPRVTLIGYKLFDADYEELVKAGLELLVESKANAIFCNNPKTAKEKKICLLPDGARFELTFDHHIEFINRILDLIWYKTKIIKTKKPPFKDSKWFIEILNKTAEAFYPYKFGCLAYKTGRGFYTTARGKKEIRREFAYVYKVDHKNKTVFADRKASLNAPLLDLIFKITGARVIVHSHKMVNAPTLDYVFSGTIEEDNIKKSIEGFQRKKINAFNILHHGYYAWFNNFEDAKYFVRGKVRPVKEVKEIQWEQYEKVFPVRYLTTSNFDSMVKREISNLAEKLGKKIDILEIGSNKTIRYYRNDLINKYYVFDRYVKINDKRVTTIKESEISSKSSKSSKSFDLVILRNSFNYLNKDEIKRLARLTRRNSCKLIFNTFKTPTVMKRPYKSKVSEGIESSKYDAKGKQIIHTLRPKGKEYEIKHSFFYYSLKDLDNLFRGLKLIKQEKGNALHIEVAPK